MSRGIFEGTNKNPRTKEVNLDIYSKHFMQIAFFFGAFITSHFHNNSNNIHALIVSVCCVQEARRRRRSHRHAVVYIIYCRKSGSVHKCEHAYIIHFYIVSCRVCVLHKEVEPSPTQALDLHTLRAEQIFEETICVVYFRRELFTRC